MNVSSLQLERPQKAIVLERRFRPSVDPQAFERGLRHHPAGKETHRGESKARKWVLAAAQATTKSREWVRRKGASAAAAKQKAASHSALDPAPSLHGLAPLFAAVPLFMVEEEVSRLMLNRPPFGYNLPSFSVDELQRKRKNATLPSVRMYDSCAVVGSSGTLLRSLLGAEIDAHDAVWRINGAPGQAEWRAYAGMKTTVRVFASPHASPAGGFKEEALFPNTTFLTVCDRSYIYSCQNLMFDQPKPRWHNINPIFYHAVRRETDRRKASERSIVVW